MNHITKLRLALARLLIPVDMLPTREEADLIKSIMDREVLESAPRRAGKSVRLRGLMLWRMEHGDALFGETQTIMHTGSDVAICREIQRGAWRCTARAS